MDDMKTILDRIRAYFLMWSWAVVLGAYISTSALFANQMFSLQQGGMQSYEYAGISFSMVTLLAYMSMLILTLGWMFLLRYSRAVFGIAVLSDGLNVSTELDSSENMPNELYELLHLFRHSLMYLAMAWIVALVAGALPSLVILLETV